MKNFSDAELVKLTSEQLNQLTPEQLTRRNKLIEDKKRAQMCVVNPVVKPATEL